MRIDTHSSTGWRLWRIAAALMCALVPCLSSSTMAIAASPVTTEAVGALRAESLPSDLVVLDSSAQSITFQLDVPAYQLRHQTDASGADCVSIYIEGFGSSGTAGAPDVPVRLVTLAIDRPEQSSLVVLEADYVEDVLPAPICPIASPVLSDDLDAVSPEAGTELVADDAIYGRNALWPTSSAQIGEAGYLRNLPVAQISLNPVQVNPVTGVIRSYTRILARLSAPGATAQTTAVESTRISPDDAYLPIYEQAIANWDDALLASGPAAEDQQPVAAQTEESLAPSLKLLVSQTAMYKVSYAELQGADFPVDTLDPRAIGMTHLGQPVAIYVAGEDDGVLDPEDYVVFHGESIRNVYTAENAYWLSWDGSSVARMAQQDARPEPGTTTLTQFADSIHLEQNASYVATRPSGDDNDHWYWNYVRADGGPAQREYVFSISELSSETQHGSLTALLRSYSDSSGAHDCEIKLNGNLVAQAIWPQGTDYTVQADVDYAYYQSGVNTLTVVCGVDAVAGDSDIVFVNWFDISYPRTFTAEADSLAFSVTNQEPGEAVITGLSSEDVSAYDVTDANAPVALTVAVTAAEGTFDAHLLSPGTAPASYVVLTGTAYPAVDSLEVATPRDLRSSANGADYIMVAPRAFMDALAPLVTLRTAEGLRVDLIAVEDVYDVFGYGISDADAIRSFLSYAYTEWVAPAPTYVLLVGDSNYDPKNYMGRNEPSYVHAYLADVDPWLGETSADNMYVAVSGDDIFPDMYLGRLPARSVADVQAMVDKIIAYESAPAGEWQHQLAFVADEQPDPLGAGDFWTLSDRIIDLYVPSRLAVERIYYKSDSFPTATDARAGVANAFESGRLIVNYVGHGSTQFWSSAKLLQMTGVAALTNTIYPLMLPMTCLEGYYLNPPTASGADFSSLSETLVRAASKGAIASFAPGGEGIATGHHYMQEGFYTAVFEDGITELGAATTAGKLNLYTSTAAYRELIQTYLLMGDPALKLRAPGADQRLYMPLITR